MTSPPTHSLNEAPLPRSRDPRTADPTRSGRLQTRPLVRRAWSSSPAASLFTSLEKRRSALEKSALYLGEAEAAWMNREPCLGRAP